MSNPFPKHLLMLSVLALCGPAASAWSQVRIEAPVPRSGPAEVDMPRETFASPAQRSRMMGDAVRRVQQSTGGRVLGAERVQFDGRDITRVKVMDERGRIRYMDDDPQDHPQRGRRRGGALNEDFRSPRPHGDNPAGQ